MKVAPLHLLGIALAMGNTLALAGPMFGATNVSGEPGQSVVVSLKDLTEDTSTDGFFGANILVEFDATRLSYDSPSTGLLGTLVFEVNDIAPGQVLVTIGGYMHNGNGASLLDVGFSILSPQDVFGPTNVVFRCVAPFTPGAALPDFNLVTDQPSADEICRPGLAQDFDYAIPPTTGFVDIVASTAQVPAPGTAPLALLGLGLMSWMWRRRSAS